MLRHIVLISAVLFSSSYSLGADIKKRLPTPSANSSSSQDVQDTQPTLKESVDWLKEKFVVYGGGETSSANLPPSSTKYEDIKFEGCSMSFVSTLIIGSPPGMSIKGANFKSETTFSFSDIDARSIKQTTRSMGISSISMMTKLNESRITSSKTSSLSTALVRESKNVVEFTVRDEEISKRMAKALERIATLCSTNKEKF